jgi:hypothetical protein
MPSVASSFVDLKFADWVRANTQPFDDKKMTE